MIRKIAAFFAVVMLLSVCAFAKVSTDDIYSGEPKSVTLEKKDGIKYTFFADEDGFATFKIPAPKFENESITRNAKAKVTVFKGGKVLLEFQCDKRDNEFEYLFTLGLEEGEYTLHIENMEEFESINVSVDFEFKSHDYVESFGNTSFEKAQNLSFNNKYFGGTFTKDDKDFYKFEVKEDGYINAYLGINTPKLFEFYDKDFKLFSSIEVDLEDTRYALERRIGLKKGTYYISVRNSQHLSDSFYMIKLTQSASNSFESENNNDFENADKINVSNEYKGNLITFEDKDFFTFTLDKKSDIEIHFVDSVASKTKHYDCTLFDKNKNPLTSLSGLEKGTYFYKVECPEQKVFSEHGYRFEIKIKKTYDGVLGGKDEEIADFPTEEITPYFNDVTQSDWFYPYVIKAAKNGILKGVGNNLFLPQGNVKLSEVITIATRLYDEKNNTTMPESTNVQSDWYEPYVEYAEKIGIIKKGEFSDFERDAKRQEVAYILSNAIGKTDVAIDNITIPDVSLNDKYAQSIYKLYALKVLSGNDALGTFYPERSITRAEISKIAVLISEL